MQKTNLPENLYRLRRSRGLSQEEFAEKLGVSRQAISKWERGEAYPETENLITISRLFSVTIDELINSESISREPDAAEEKRAEGDTDGDSQPRADLSYAFKRGIDDEDEDCEDEEENEDKDEDREDVKHGLRFNLTFILRSLPYVVIVTGAFLTIGLLADGFYWAWTLFLTIPVYDSVVDIIRTGRLSEFAFPVFITFLYCLFGMLYGLWHPLWLLYLLIPVYYPIAESIDKVTHRNK